MFSQLLPKGLNIILAAQQDISILDIYTEARKIMVSRFCKLVPTARGANMQPKINFFDHLCMRFTIMKSWYIAHVIVVSGCGAALLVAAQLLMWW